MDFQKRYNEIFNNSDEQEKQKKINNKEEDLYDAISEEGEKQSQIGLASNFSFNIMLPYADLMTLLLVFFVFFFIISDYNMAKQIVEENMEVVEEDEEIIEKAKLDSLLDLNEQVITIPGEILFESGQADLRWSAKQALVQVAENIRRWIGDDDSWELRIEGHTDNVPIFTSKYASNWELSTARALRIVRFFMVNNFFPPEQMQAMGYGEFKPLVPNTSPTNKALNRRVEIRLSRKYKVKPES